MATKTWAITADAIGATDGSNEYGGDCSHLPVGYMSWLGGASRAFLKFAVDYSGVVQITSAVLHVWTSSASHGSIGGSNTCLVDLVTSAWAEGAHPGETWFLNDQPDFSESVDTGYRATFSARAESTHYTVDVTAIANRWAPATVKQSNGSAGPGVANNGIRIASNNEGASANRTEFWAREGGTDAYIVLTYTTNQAPAVASLDSPANGATITDDTPALLATLDDPDAADTVTHYAVQVDDDPAFGSPAINLTSQAIGVPANRVQVTHTCTALTRGRTWYWRFQARDNVGAWGAWSAARQFYLATQPTADTFSPTGNAFAYIHNLGEAALWTDGSFAKARVSFRYVSSSALASKSYRIRLYDVSSGGSPIADTGNVAWVAASGTTKTYDANTALPRNTSRWWTVEVIDSASGTSGESARQQFRVQWGQAQYEANPGAGSSSWDFDLGTVTNGYAAAAFRTATAADASGGGTRSAWNTSIANLVPAAWVNIVVRIAANTAGTNVTLADATFTYAAGSTTPDNWTRQPSGEWALSTSQRRFGAKSLKCTMVANTAGYRYVYPFRNATGDDIPVIPGVTYTWSAYVKTPAPLTGNAGLYLEIKDGNNVLIPGTYKVRDTAFVTDTTAEPDGWQRLAMTFIAPPGWTLIRPYVTCRDPGGAEPSQSFYLDGAKLEEGPVATPWQAGALGAVILDSGGIAVDGLAGGAFRLRGGSGTDRDVVELSDHGLLFGGDSELWSPATGILRTDAILQLGADVTLRRWAADILRTDDTLHVGAPTTAGSSGVQAAGSGSIELVANAGTPYIDLKNSAADDFDIRLILTDDNTLDVQGGNLDVIGGVYESGVRLIQPAGLALQYGIANVVIAAGAFSGSLAVTFSRAFTSAPAVVLTPSTGSGAFIAMLNGAPTASAFGAYIRHRADAVSPGTYPVNWVAIGPA